MKSRTLIRGAMIAGAIALQNPQGAFAAAKGENTPLNFTSSAGGSHTASSGGSILRTILALLIVIAVIYGAAWLLRRFKGPRSTKATGSALAPLSRLPLGNNRSVQLVQVGTDYLLLGVSEQGITRLRTYTESEAQEAGLLGDEDDPVSASVQSRPGPRGSVLDQLRRMTVRS